MELLPVFKANADCEQVANIKYILGDPRQIRFDAKLGIFKLGESQELGKTLSFQPLAWEFFEGDILNMGAKKWVELFFLDAKNVVCSILFHGYSVDNLKQISTPLFYDDLSLADVVLTITPSEKINNKIKPAGKYFIAEFTYEMADEARTADLAELTTKIDIFREGTINHTRNAHITQGYRVPDAVISRILVGNGNGHALPEPK